MYRSITLARADPTPEAVAIVLFENVNELPARYAELDRQAGGLITRTIARGEAKPSKASVSVVYPESGPERIFVVGLGDRDRFSAETLRLGIGRLTRVANAAKVTRLQVEALPGLGDLLDADHAGGAVGDGLALAGFAFDQFKGAATRKDNAQADEVDLAVSVDDALHDAVSRALTVGRCVATSRRLSATPPNVANPRYIAEQCRTLAEEVGLRCRVIDAEEADRLGMGGLTAVGRGGSTPPALIVLEWPGHDAGAKPILLVGKTITFDTGGYSVKPSASMTGMKFDKDGGMAVIGAMEAIARLKLPRRVVALLPTAENMIGRNAFRVDDILTFCNGVTSEITNTDAEGRLVLADALAYGTREFDPIAVVDLATLTGGVVVALGNFCAGLFCNDDELRSRIEHASDFTGERLWQLPLWDDHRDMMKGTYADLVNSGERKAHPIQGAAFLSFFVGPDAPRKMPTIPWAHLDIAGVHGTDSETPLFNKGPTGWGVRLLTRLVAEWR